MTSPASRSARIWLWAAVVLTLVKLWLTRGQPVFALGQAGHDDRLFVELANHLRHGDWLGPYNNLTLAKGPFYSMWIAAMAFIGIPLFLSQQVFYAFACAALVRAIAPAVTSSAARFGCYALLLANPMSFEASSLGRVLRQHVYSPLVLLIFAGLAALYFRRPASLRQQAAWSVLLGLSAAAFWLTREESIWIAPSVGLLALAIVFAAWRESREALRRVAFSFGLAATAALLPLIAVCAQNYRHYGWWGTVEFRAAAFNDAYGAMVRVRVGPDLPFVPVTREAREAMYAVSPTFAKLRPQFEGPVGRGWAGVSSGVTKLPEDRLEIGGGWLMWALRDAVAAAGSAHSAREALAFYRDMAAEINRACDDGRLPATGHRSGFLPRLHPGDAHRIVETFATFSEFVVTLKNFSAMTPPSDEEASALFRELTHERLSDSSTPADGRALALHSFGKAMRVVWPVLFVAGLVSVIVRVVFALRTQRLTFPLCLAVAAIGAGIAYVLIQAIIDATSFPVLVISSFAPVYPLLPLFMFAAAWDAWLAWAAQPASGDIGAAGGVSSPPPELPEIFLPARAVAWLPWLAALLAVVPFLVWQREFASLVWFADDYMLVDEIAQMGFWKWTVVPFTESFVPVFKVFWGGTLLGFDGSYRAMLGLIWLTHLVNTLLFGLLLRRAGFPWFATVVVQIVFGLSAGNVETLGWSVQWSALLATTFLLLGLLWQEIQAPKANGVSLKAHGPLLLLAAASAASFARGVLTGGIFALREIEGAIRARDWRQFLRALPAALLCLLPSLAVAIVIETVARGNHAQMSGHWFAAAEFAATFFLANPVYLLLGEPGWSLGLVVAVGGLLKLAVIAWALRRATGRTYVLLLALVVYDCGNAALLGVGRYHTGLSSAMISRYYYCSLLATLPFLGLWLQWLVGRIPAPARVRSGLAIGLAVLAAGICLAGWPAALRQFVPWRGPEMRALLAAPANPDPNARVPALEFMHIERAKALQRAYDLH